MNFLKNLWLTYRYRTFARRYSRTYVTMEYIEELRTVEDIQDYVLWSHRVYWNDTSWWLEGRTIISEGSNEQSITQRYPLREVRLLNEKELLLTPTSRTAHDHD